MTARAQSRRPLFAPTTEPVDPLSTIGETTPSSRIDQAISPAGLIKSAVCFSMFVTEAGLYLIKTGRGWRMNFDLGIGTEAVADNLVTIWSAQRNVVEAQLDVANLAAEVAARKGSTFIPASELSAITLGQRRDGLPDLKFHGGREKYRVQFDNGRQGDVEAFVATLSELAGCGSGEMSK